MALNNNLARNLHSEMPEKAPQIQPQRPKQTPAPKKQGITKGERILIAASTFIIFALSVACVYLEIMVADANREMQDTDRSVEEIVVVNNNLSQEVQELSRYDRVYAIAKANGLEMNEKNVRNVSK